MTEGVILSIAVEGFELKLSDIFAWKWYVYFKNLLFAIFAGSKFFIE